MKEIYLGAKYVVSWLGPAEGRGDFALKKLESAGKRIVLDTQQKEAQYYGDSEYSIPGADSDISISATDDNATFPLHLLDDIFRRPYWQRVWIAQELAYAKEACLMCGGAVVNWHLFKVACKYLLDYRFSSQIPAARGDYSSSLPFEIMSVRIPQLSTIDSEATYSQCRISKPLEQLLLENISPGLQIIDLKASDPRDKIYGILSFCSDSKELWNEVNYSKPCEILYTEVSETLLRRGKLRMLSFCQFPKALRGLPSWVPDWSAPLERDLIDQKQKWFRASGDSELSLNFRDSLSGSRGLLISGILVDRVIDTGSTCSTEILFPPIEEFIKLVSELEGLTRRYTESEKYPDYIRDIWRIPIANTERCIKNEDFTYCKATNTSFSSYLAIHNYISLTGNSQNRREQLLNSMKLYFDTFALFSRGRKPFITEQSHFLCIGADSVKKGDLVVVFLGSRVPCVIREVECGAFQLVGEAYVHRIMKGELMKTKPAMRDFLIV
jgi:hypothetical protein